MSNDSPAKTVHYKHFTIKNSQLETFLLVRILCCRMDFVFVVVVFDLDFVFVVVVVVFYPCISLLKELFFNCPT